MIRGAVGEDIEEPEDLEKELALLDKRLGSVGDKAVDFLNQSSFDAFLNLSGIPLLNATINYSRQFRRFYSKTLVTVTKNPNFFVQNSSRSAQKNLDPSTDFPDLLDS